MESLSFDGLVGSYDETRTFDRACFEAALDFIQERYPPVEFPRVLEPGIGSGRIAIPVAQRGYHVQGVDISEQMLTLLRHRLAACDPPVLVAFQKADVTSLPFDDGAFDMALPVHLFWFVADWRRAVHEIARVVKPGGPIILMHTGTGMEIPALNERYKQLCAERGCPIPTIGARSTREVVDYLAEIGHRAEWVRDRWCWTQRIELGRALDHLRARAYSFATFAPGDVHAQVLRQLEAELAEQPGGLGHVVEVANQIYLVLIRSAACA